MAHSGSADLVNSNSHSKWPSGGHRALSGALTGEFTGSDALPGLEAEGVRWFLPAHTVESAVSSGKAYRQISKTISSVHKANLHG